MAASSAHENPLPSESIPAAHAPAAPVAHPAERVAAASAVAETVRLAPAPAAEDVTFGLDINGDGLPDSLERFVRKTLNAPATRMAARHYYRIALPLATRAQQGETLAHADKQSVFKAAECYWLAAAEDNIEDPPNLNDRAALIGSAAADRMLALAEALQGFNYRLSTGKRMSCS